MATITEDYVGFETAKLLKEKGFDEKCFHYYEDNRHLNESIKFSNWYNSEYSNSNIGRRFTAPTLQMAMKWLREVHSIDVSIIPLRSHKEYLPRIESDTISHDAIPCRKYEEACEVAIKYCLENLI